MEVEARVEDVVARLWPGRTATIEVLGGGITNHNLKITLAGEAYVLRIAGQDTGLLGIDRSVEHEASQVAAAAGVGPEVLAFVEPEGYLVTSFIDGAAIPIGQMRRPETLARVAEALRAVHAGPPLGGHFDSFRIVEDYRATALAHGAEVPDDYDWAGEIAQLIEPVRAAQVERPCHNDLLNANFIDDGERVRIVDWEYAGMGDVFFDLANFAINHELNDEGRRTLLAAYFGEVRAEDARALELMRFMSDFREAMWGVVQTAISQLDFGFAGYAAEHFERLRQTAAEPGFRACLGAH